MHNFNMRIGCKIPLPSEKRLRSDGGGESVWSKLSNWLKARGMVHKATTSHSQEFNGSAEMLNLFLLDMSQTMLVASDL